MGDLGLKYFKLKTTVCPESSDPPEKLLNIFASENEVYTIFLLLRYFRLNIIRLQSKIILGHITRLYEIVRFNNLAWVTTSWTYSTYILYSEIP